MPYRPNSGGSKNFVQGVTVIISALVFLVTLIIGIVAEIQFGRHYEGHLKRAADANSLQLAENELTVAVAYLDDNGYNTEEGRNLAVWDDHTNVLWTTPDKQLSFHYNNVTASLAGVREVIAKGDGATPLEKSNVLMKLRETLLDDSSSGHNVTYPGGMSVYPYNLEIWLGLLLPWVFAIPAFLLWERN